MVYFPHSVFKYIISYIDYSDYNEHKRVWSSIRVNRRCDVEYDEIWFSEDEDELLEEDGYIHECDFEYDEVDRHIYYEAICGDECVRIPNTKHQWFFGYGYLHEYGYLGDVIVTTTVNLNDHAGGGKMVEQTHNGICKLLS
jgi:hypothetical protein